MKSKRETFCHGLIVRERSPVEVILKQKLEKILGKPASDATSCGVCTEKRKQTSKVVIDVRNVIAISKEGENMLLELVNEGVRFRSLGVFTKQVLRQLTRRNRREHWAVKEMNYLQANFSGGVRAVQLQIREHSLEWSPLQISGTELRHIDTSLRARKKSERPCTKT
jgi:hypothetical protein